MGRQLLAWVRFVTVTLATLGWGLGALAVATWVVLGASGATASTTLFCDDSNPGKLSWSWFPLGHECTWTEEANGFDLHEPAGPWLSIVVVTLAVSGVVLERAWHGLDPVVVRRQPGWTAESAPVPGSAQVSRLRDPTAEVR